MYEDDEDVQGHGVEGQHNETVVEDEEDDEDVQGHGIEAQHNETVVEDEEEHAGS